MKGLFEYQYLSFRKGYLQNLVAMAKSDGHVHEDEIKLIYKIGEKYRLKPRQVDELINDPQVHELTVPDSTRQRIGLLYELVLVMMADGVIHPNEMNFCTSAAKKFSLPTQVLDELIAYYNLGAENHLEWSQFIDGIMSSLALT